MFIDTNIEILLEKLSKLTPENKPEWGSMNAQRMVEHLTDILNISTGKTKLELQIPEDKIERMQAFLDTEKPMAKNSQVDFAKKESPLRHEELELAIDEFIEEWINFEEYYAENPEKTESHPFYGDLDFRLWNRLHSKHITHHFEQFNLI
jgi:hydroxymethylglutaryl-CoA reductase